MKIDNSFGYRAIIYQSHITCPLCGHEKEETMAENACQVIYECDQCHTLIKPKQGDCCVFCSYGSVKCPPVQKGKRDC